MSPSDPSPAIGILCHWIGGLAAASFYLPFARVRRWSWETSWLVAGVFSWIVAPWVFATLLVPDVPGVLRASSARTLGVTYLFGLLWGVGGLTFGLTMRYLGIALGYAIALGLCAAFGTLVPPLYSGEFGKLLAPGSGRAILLGVMVCLAGIAFSGLAGVSKEKELSRERKKEAVREFNFAKGLAVALVCGLLSACFSFGLSAGAPLSALAKERLLAAGGSDLWQGLPAIVVILWGGFTTNLFWCLALNRKNRSGGEYLRLRPAAEAPPTRPDNASLFFNYTFCALAGVTWYFQFFFYSMGSVRLGRDYDFASWTLHMAAIILFSTVWGLLLKEWRGTSRRTHLLIGLGLAALVASTVIVGYGNYLGAQATAH
jgi:L-rhamnose-H+ transport protein